MKRKILRGLWLIPLIAGICLGIFGIQKKIEANNMTVPDMSQAGWFDAEDARSKANMAGIAMISIGFVVLPMISVFVGVFAKHATMTPEEQAETAAKGVESAKRFTEKFKELTGATGSNDDEALDPTNSERKIKYCSFCGSENESSATKCTSCGASFPRR